MTDLARIQLSMILFSARFWIATFVLFFTSQGISLSETFTLIGIYYVASLLLEYPTGVIGDYYSHRLSVGLGYGILALGNVLFFFVSGYWYFLAILLLMAIGQSLVSGSDTALFHTVSKNFKKDYANINTFTILSDFGAITLGAWAASYDVRYPFFLTASALILACLLVFSLKHYHYQQTGGADVFEVGRHALRLSWRNKEILSLLILGSSVLGFFYTFKWIYNPIFQAIDMPVSWWGFLSGVTILCIALGTKLYGYLPNFRYPLLIIILSASIALGGLFDWPAIVLLSLVASHAVRGYFETKITVDLNEEIHSSYRSSILSLKGVIVRIVSGGYIFIGAVMVKYFSLTWFLTGTALALLIMGFGALILKKKTLSQSVAH